MAFVNTLYRVVPKIRELVLAKTDRLTRIVATRDVDLKEMHLLALWGGGKDSTIALILAKAVADNIGCRLTAVSMDNPGMTASTLENISRVATCLDVEHEWWHFARQISSYGTHREDWNELYRALATELNGHPRFMCVACNLGSIVTEFAALQFHHSTVLITGNSGAEFAAFEKWVRELRIEFGALVELPDQAVNGTSDYYRFWHAIYSRLLRDLFESGGTVQSSTANILDRYLYNCPADKAAVQAVYPFNVLDDFPGTLDANLRGRLLDECGWSLPSDIQGGTESDCGFTAAISHINIIRKGMASHLRDLEDAADHFNATSEMRNRAKEWALSGDSALQGHRQLQEMGVTLSDCGTGKNRIAAALADKLFKIR